MTPEYLAGFWIEALEMRICFARQKNKLDELFSLQLTAGIKTTRELDTRLHNMGQITPFDITSYVQSSVIQLLMIFFAKSPVN